MKTYPKNWVYNQKLGFNFSVIRPLVAFAGLYGWIFHSKRLRDFALNLKKLAFTIFGNKE